MKKNFVSWAIGGLLMAGLILGIPFLVNGWIGSNFTVQLTSPANASTPKLYITCQGIAWDSSNDIAHIYCQAYKDVDKDGVIDTGESSWTTFSDVTDFCTTVNSNITADYAGTSTYFDADSKYWIRMYALNSAGEASASPNVENILGGTGGWSDETDCYAYITIPVGGLRTGARPTW